MSMKRGLIRKSSHTHTQYHAHVVRQKSLKRPIQVLPNFVFLAAGFVTRFPSATVATCLATACLIPPFILGLRDSTKVSTIAAPKAVVTILVPFMPIQGLGSLRSLTAATAPASRAVRAAPIHSSFLPFGLLSLSLSEDDDAAGDDLRRREEWEGTVELRDGLDLLDEGG